MLRLNPLRSVSRRPLCSSAFKSLTADALRDASNKQQKATSAATAYQVIKERGDSDGAEAQRLRREKLISDAELNNPFMARQRLSAAGSMSTLGIDAQFAQMERRGEFKNLAGSGKPFEYGSGSPFTGDALDEWIEKYAAREGVQRESSVLANQYISKLKAFRQRLRHAATGGVSVTLNRQKLEYEMGELHKLHKKAEDTSITDSLAYSSGGRAFVPRLGTLDEELAKARGQKS